MYQYLVLAVGIKSISLVRGPFHYFVQTLHLQQYYSKVWHLGIHLELTTVYPLVKMFCPKP